MDPDEFEKYDPNLSRGVRRYVLAQFLVAVLMVLWIGQISATQSLAAVIIPCVLLWALLLSLGQLNEGMNSAAKFELFRLFVISPISLYGLLQGAGSSWDPAIAWASLGVYLVLSVVLLRPAWQVELRSE